MVYRGPPIFTGATLVTEKRSVRTGPPDVSGEEASQSYVRDGTHGTCVVGPGLSNRLNGLCDEGPSASS